MSNSSYSGPVYRTPVTAQFHVSHGGVMHGDGPRATDSTMCRKLLNFPADDHIV